MSARRNIVVFISGRGSNLRALLESEVGGRIGLVLTDNPRAEGLVHAGRHRTSVATVEYEDRGRFEHVALRLLRIHDPCLVALAGFMRILSADFISRVDGWIVNIHPSLLPELPGLHTHRRVLETGMKRHGCTVHWVRPQVDGGGVIAQEAVDILADDDEESLARRVLAAEHRLYPAAVARIFAAGLRPGERPA